MSSYADINRKRTLNSPRSSPNGTPRYTQHTSSSSSRSGSPKREPTVMDSPRNHDANEERPNGLSLLRTSSLSQLRRQQQHSPRRSTPGSPVASSPLTTNSSTKQSSTPFNTSDSASSSPRPTLNRVQQRFPLRRANTMPKNVGSSVRTTFRSSTGSSTNSSPLTPNSPRLDRIREASPRVKELSQPIVREPVLPADCVFSPKINSKKKSFGHVKPKYLEAAKSKSQLLQKQNSEIYGVPIGNSRQQQQDQNSEQDSSPLAQSRTTSSSPRSCTKAFKKHKVSQRLNRLSKPIERKNPSAQDLDRECTFRPETTFYKEDV